MDLDLTPEQDMLRDAVAGVCARHCAARRRARDGGRPGRLLRRVLDAARRARAPRHAAARAVRRERDVDARRRRRLPGARPCAGAVTALRELGDERGRHPRHRFRRAEGRVAHPDQRGRGRRHAGMAGAARRVRAGGHPPRPRPPTTAAGGSTAPSATSRSRARPTGCSCSPAPTPGRRSSSSTRTRRASR